MPTVTVYTRNTQGLVIDQGNFGVGTRFTFSDDVLTSPQLNPATGAAQGDDIGTHSGFSTWVRNSPPLSMYEATFDLKPAPGSTAPKKGQVTTRGVLSFESWDENTSRTVAITGGTGPYAEARGEHIWTKGPTDPNSPKHPLPTTIDKHELHILP
jgi:hypothetical protein